MDPQVFTKTITAYNIYVDAGYDSEFEKSPFYATPWKPVVHHTMGGLKINTKTYVINKQGQVIQGLYAAGEVAGGLHAGNRLGGNFLTDIFTFGRIAAEIAITKNC